MSSWRSSHAWREVPLFIFSLFLGAAFTVTSCSPGGDTLTGLVVHGEAPVEGATVNVYLEKGEGGGGRPFLTGTTGKEGRFALKTGRGEFYVVARKVTYEGGRERVLRGRPGREPVSPGGGRDIVIALAPVEEKGFTPDPDTCVTGVVKNPFGEPEETFVFAYDGEKGILSGPTFLNRTQVDKQGKFNLCLKKGSYHIIAMKKASGSEVGPMTGAGLRAEYGDNPVVLAGGENREIGTLTLSRPDPGKLVDLSKLGGLTGTGYSVSGKVLLEDGAPAPGLYVMAYLDRRMIGRPESISEGTDSGGAFTINLPGPGVYFLGAREAIGGPLSPGELTGTYEGSPDHAVPIQEKGEVPGLEIVVREKW